MTFEEMLDHALAILQRHGRLTYRTLQRQFHLDDDALNDLKDALLYTHPEVHDDEGQGLVWTGESSRASQRALAGLVRYYGDAGGLVLVQALLQREGRLSYRRLTRICGLDEAGLADLREDLLFQRLARDEDGQGLVWIGSAPPPDTASVAFDTATCAASAAPLLASDSTPTEPTQDGPTLAPEPSRRALEAEHRQVTVMFCDLVASTELSQQLDPEDYRAVVRAYQTAAADAIQPYDGYIAQYLGDGLLVYFGWPQAHEDAAPRAVYASLALLDALGPLHDTHLVPQYGVRIAVRIGLHTGMAVIGEMGGGDRSELLAMGDTPNLAARIQGLATPNTVALSAATVRLIQGAFALEDLGTHALKGVAEPMPVFRVLGPIEVHHDEEEPALGVPTLVGRDEEIGILRRRWEQATEGLGQVVLVSGEAGIGKSALVRTVRHHIGREGVVRITYRCSPYHTHSAFYPILAVLTFRPEFVPPWPARSHMTSLTLNRLERPQIEALVRQQAGGKRLPPEVVAHIVAKTDGVPLFVEELTKAILESALLREEADHYELTGPLSAVTIPATLQDSLLARLDRLPTMREVAQIGAVLGREFAYEMLHALVTVDERTLLEGLAQLVAAELLYQRGRPPRATYIFKHALVRDAAYQSLLRRTRQQYHQQVAALLEARFPETVVTAPEVVAHHYTEAGCAAQALLLWQQAGQRALQRSANLEGIEHLTKGRAVLATLPDTTDRLQHELDLHVALGPAFIATRGYASPEAEHTFARAWELCQRLGEPPQRFSVLYGLCAFYFVGGKHRQARDQAEQFLHLAQLQGDMAPLMMAHRALGMPLYFMGEVAQAREHFAQSMALYDPEQHRTLAFSYGQDPGVGALMYDALALWVLGYPEQALRRSHEACTLAEGLAHPHTLAYGFTHLAMFHQFRQEREEARRYAEVATRVSREQGFPFFFGAGLILQGWTRAARPQPAEQLPSMHEGMALCRATGAVMGVPYLLTLLAETYGAASQPDAGLRCLDEAHTVMDSTQERFYEAEVHRVQGELVLAQAADQHAQAETCFQHALAIARRQQARSWELRAAMSLARLWQQQGRQSEAYELLAPIYGWFTEGFDTADLQEARALLDTLGG